MSKIRLTKRCYTSPQNVRVVSAGIYDTSDFSTKEIEFLQSLNAVKYLEPVQVKKVEKTEILSAPVTIAKEEIPAEIEVSVEPIEEEATVEVKAEDIPLPEIKPKKSRRRRKTQEQDKPKE